MLDLLRIRNHLKDLRERLIELETKFKPLSEVELLSDKTLYNAAEHHLQLAIQNCLDVANHIVSALVLSLPKKEASESFFILAEEGIITKNLAEIMKSVVGYRNVVVHGYMDVDKHVTYENIQKGLPDLIRFAKEIEVFLEKRGKKDK